MGSGWGSRPLDLCPESGERAAARHSPGALLRGIHPPPLHLLSLLRRFIEIFNLQVSFSLRSVLRGGGHGDRGAKRRDIVKTHHRRPCDNRGRDGRDTQPHAESTSNHQKKQESSPRSLHRAQPTLGPWISSLQICERVHFCCCKPPACDDLSPQL